MNIVRLYRRVGRELGPERRLAGALLCANGVLATAQFAEPWLFGRVIDTLAHGEALGQRLGLSSVAPLIAAWVAVGAFNIAAGVTVALHADRLAHRRRQALHAKFFRHVLSLPVAFHGQTHSGRLMKTMQTGAFAMWRIWLGLFREHAASLLALFVLLPASLLFEVRLGLLLSGFVVLFAIGMYCLIRHTEARQRAVERFHTELSEYAADTFGNIPVVQSYTRQGREVQALEGVIGRLLGAQIPVLNWWAVGSVATRTAAAVTLTAVLIYGTWLQMHGEVSVGQVVASMSLASMLVNRLEATMGFIQDLFVQVPNLQRFFAVLDARTSVEEPHAPVPVTSVQGHVRFEEVSFGYRQDRPSLREVSFEARPGDKIALVGSTGAGKSTTMALLYRAYDPWEGRILIDGVELQRYDLDTLRGQIGVVFQEPLLFARTVRDNLLVGCPGATDAQLWEALERAQAFEMVRGLHAGLDTVLSERGGSLSGGERQRLAIARALLKAPPILILDEATAPLDAATEQRLSLALEEVMRGRTTFLIAHRLATVRHATRILVFEQGRVIEAGSYEELVARRGRFAQLAEAQVLA